MRKPAIQTFGEAVLGVTLKGDPCQPEPETFRVALPWGTVDITRSTDIRNPDYWVHIRAHQPDDVHSGFAEGEFKAARLDQTDKHAFESDLGNFNRPTLYHVAVKIGAKG